MLFLPLLQTVIRWILCFFSIEMNIFQHEDEIPYEEEMEAQVSVAKESV